MKELLDEPDICDLVAAYSCNISHFLPKAAAALFTVDGVLSIIGHSVTTCAAIAAGMRSTFGQFEMLPLDCHGPQIEVVVGRDTKAVDLIFGSLTRRMDLS